MVYPGSRIVRPCVFMKASRSLRRDICASYDGSNARIERIFESGSRFIRTGPVVPSGLRKTVILFLAQSYLIHLSQAAKLSDSARYTVFFLGSYITVCLVPSLLTPYVSPGSLIISIR